MSVDLPATTILATYGALMSSISIVLTCYAIVRERSRLIINLYNTVPETFPTGDGDTKYYFVRVANPGRRPAAVQELKLECRDRTKKVHLRYPTYVIDEKGQQRPYDQPLRPNSIVSEGTVLWFLVPTCVHEVVPYRVTAIDGHFRYYYVRPKHGRRLWWAFYLGYMSLSDLKPADDEQLNDGRSSPERPFRERQPHVLWSRAQRMARWRALRRTATLISQDEKLSEGLPDQTGG